MKFSPLLALLVGVHGHTIVQKVSVNGVDQGALVGVRTPSSNNPILSAVDPNIACNLGVGHKDNTIITIPQGAKVGAWWGHVIGGPQSNPDPENPIAKSHKGPIQVYLASVDNAASTGTTGLKWFKVAQEGLNNGVWAVDTMIAGNGWWYFNLPTCVTAGQYLMRVELLALHSAGQTNGAQFYMGCAQIAVTGSGTSSPATVSFPGAYAQGDPGISINIYGSTGLPDNGGRAYAIPGPLPMTCAAGGSTPTTTLVTSARPTTTTSKPTTTTTAKSTTTTVAGGSSGGAALYAQCGGTGWTGATTCASGTCKASSQYYSQCLP